MLVDLVAFEVANVVHHFGHGVQDLLHLVGAVGGREVRLQEVELLVDQFFGDGQRADRVVGLAGVMGALEGAAVPYTFFSWKRVR